MGSFPSSATATLSVEDVKRILGSEDEEDEMFCKVKERMTEEGQISTSEFFAAIDPLSGTDVDVEELQEMSCEYDEGILTLDEEIQEASQLDCSDMDLEEFDVEPRKACLFVASLDVSGNNVEDPSTFLSHFLFVRVLNLSGNPIKNVESFANLRFVTDLDLSFVSFQNQDLSKMYASCFPRLKRCNMENCELTNIPKWGCSDTLIELYLSENNIDSLENLAGYETLKQLDLSSNPVSSGSSTKEYKDNVLAMLPSLITLDKSRVLNRNKTEVKTTAKPLSLIEDIGNALLLNDTVADQMEFSKDKCSCLEGSPCISEYVCKDWAHRFDIAKAVRLRKGIRDLSGDIT